MIFDFSAYDYLLCMHAGLPYVQWDGAGGAEPINPGPSPSPTAWDGYCVHGSVLFPTWHRPYTALYEVRFSNKRKASSFELTDCTANYPGICR